MRYAVKWLIAVGILAAVTALVITTTACVTRRAYKALESTPVGVTGSSLMPPASSALAASSLAPTDLYDDVDAGGVLADAVVDARIGRSKGGSGEGTEWTIAPTKPEDELWVIVRRPVNGGSSLRRTSYRADVPGQGVMVGRRSADEPPLGLVALRHTDVNATVRASIAEVNVRQQYHNSFSQAIEAEYVFPLPDDAAVNGFVMTIGARKIRGVIREKEEAEQIYAEARALGYRAALLTQQRPNIFTQRVANIAPGESIDIDITYFHTLAYRDGEFDFHFPMTILPRYNPASAGGDGVGAVGVGGSGTSGQMTEVEYIDPSSIAETRSGHDIAVSVDIDAGVPIESIISPSHAVTIDEVTSDRWRVRLASKDEVPNRDFVLRYRVAGSTPRAGMVVQAEADGEDGWFTLMLVPPAGLTSLERAPVEMIFVVDTSGSMSGEPIEQVRDAMDHALGRMREGDTFQILSFESDVTAMSDRVLPVTERNVQRARAWVRKLDGNGGTEALKAVRAAAKIPRDPSRVRFVCLMTDGGVSNESEIVAELSHDAEGSAGRARVFSFGVGTGPNRYLLEQAARVGRGAVAYLNPGDSGDEVMEAFFARIARPALSDVRLDFGTLAVSEVYPAPIPDLFVGRPVVVTGRYRGRLSPTTVTVSGTAGAVGEGGRPMLVETSTQIAVNPAEAHEHGGVRAMWARAKITDLSHALAIRTDESSQRELRGAVLATSLEHGLMSQFTAFLAVDSLSPVPGGGEPVPVVVPSRVPAGVRYESTVGPSARGG